MITWIFLLVKFLLYLINGLIKEEKEGIVYLHSKEENKNSNGLKYMKKEEINKFNYAEHYRILENNISYFTNKSLQYNQFKRRRFESMINNAKLKKGNTILDAGIGDGELTFMLASKQLYNVIGIDISSGKIKRLKRLLHKKCLKRQLFQCDVNNIPFQDRSFDCIFCSEVLEHLPEPEKAISEFHRILKPDGIVIITVPYKEKITYQVCIHCHKLTPSSGHLHSFNEINLTKLLKISGFYFTIVKTIINPLNNLRFLSYIFSLVPFSLWKSIDIMLNKFIFRPKVLMVRGIKDDTY